MRSPPMRSHCVASVTRFGFRSLPRNSFCRTAHSFPPSGAIRWSMGAAAVKRHATVIDGLTVVFLLVFVSAVMGNVAGGLEVDAGDRRRDGVAQDRPDGDQEE